MLLCTISGSLTKVCPASPHRAKLPWCTWKSHQHAWCHYVGCLHSQVMHLYEPSTRLVSLRWLPTWSSDVPIRAVDTVGVTMLAAWCIYTSHQHAWWHYVGCLHGQVPQYLVDFCSPVSDVTSRQRLWSASCCLHITLQTQHSEPLSFVLWLATTINIQRCLLKFNPKPFKQVALLSQRGHTMLRVCQ